MLLRIGETPSSAMNGVFGGWHVVSAHSVWLRGTLASCHCTRVGAAFKIMDAYTRTFALLVIRYQI